MHGLYDTISLKYHKSKSRCSGEKLVCTSSAILGFQNRSYHLLRHLTYAAVPVPSFREFKFDNKT
eukprot:3745679-Amphidinium_carterae.1